MLHHKTKEEFSALLKDSEILEALGNSNNKQVKVARLPDGRILKLFRRKGFSFTSGLRKPYCLRFKENAEKLTLMGIPSVKVEEVFHLSHTFQSGVLYPELVGTILRTVLKNANTSSRALWIARFAQFTCSLHERGIYFRALHLGNVLVSKDDRFGLIDVADMHFRKRALHLSECCRNFEHITRYNDDIQLLTSGDPGAFINAYLEAARANDKDSETMRKGFEHGCLNPQLK